MLEDLLEDLNEKYYSFIVDESTDISTIKYLAICVKYFSTKYDRIIIDFLGIVEVESSTGALLYEILEVALPFSKKMNHVNDLRSADGAVQLGRRMLVVCIEKNSIM
ncbi:hypothetical protein TcasGA2_TC006887 [Tribolium castaneum]|uniref:DUF4371 domain-containing protein n=1 Tax=Tribolium castaneum TaxID=7070 RepID=D7EIM5_TRICA|nr:hypothetical protein TcasGA2_TC006887 [Tribolium castaneum]